MSFFTVLDEINAAWEEDKATEAEYAHYMAAAYPCHPDHHALFVDPAGKYYEDPEYEYSAYEDDWVGIPPHPFTYGPPTPKFPKIAQNCFRAASYNFRDTPEIFAEWARNPDKDGLLGFLRAMVLSDNSRFNVIRYFFGNEDTSMMFADVDFPKDKKHHHIKWGTGAAMGETMGDVDHLHEYLNKANQVLNSNGMPTGEVKNGTLDLLAKEWLKDYSVKGKNPELLEEMIRAFYENMSPVAYAVLHQTMMMIYTKFVSSYGPLDETPPLMREDIAHTVIWCEFHIGHRHTREEFEREVASIREHYAEFGSKEPVWSKSFGGRRYSPTSGDFRITTGKMWYGYKGGFYPLVPDYVFMGDETAEIYKKIFHKVLRSIRDAFD